MINKKFIKRNKGGMVVSQHIIDLKNITKVYDSDTLVLDNIDLYIRKNEFLTLLGPSGCGKTTTLRIIGGFEYPTEGEIFFEGKKINDLPPYKRQINTVFQKYALFPNMSIFENIAFGLRIKKMSEKDILELTNPNVVNSNWVFFSPNQLLLEYLRNNMREEEMIANDGNTFTLEQFRKKMLLAYKLRNPETDSPFKNYSLRNGIPQPLILNAKQAICDFEIFCIDNLKSILLLW